MSIIKTHKKNIRKKVLIVVLFFAVIISTIYFIFIPKREDVTYGVTFSKPFAEHLGLDWKKAYLAILDDAGAKRIRLPSYWTEVEPEKDRYSFSDLDWQIKEAEKCDVKMIIVLGQKQPRWPECHIPRWAGEMEEKERQEELLEIIEKVVERYKDKKTLPLGRLKTSRFCVLGNVRN